MKSVQWSPLYFKKTSLVAFLISSSLLFTGCLEEILASLCDKLDSNNSIIAVFAPTSTAVSSYSNRKARLTYTNSDTNVTHTVSECPESESDFDFPRGERKDSVGNSNENITFVSVLDEAGNAFFFDDNGTPKVANFSLNIEFFDDCAEMDANPTVASGFQSGSVSLNWESALGDIPPTEGIPLVGECQITGQSAIVNVTDLN